MTTPLTKSLLAATMALGALAATAAVARADVACNRWGECWHVHEHYTVYPGDVGIVFHDNDWVTAHRDHWRLMPDRDDDHGYYDLHGDWHPFER